MAERILYHVSIRSAANVSLIDVARVIEEALVRGGFATDGVVCTGAAIWDDYAQPCEDEPEAERNARRWLVRRFEGLDEAKEAAK